MTEFARDQTIKIMIRDHCDPIVSSDWYFGLYGVVYRSNGSFSRGIKRGTIEMIPWGEISSISQEVESDGVGASG